MYKINDSPIIRDNNKLVDNKICLSECHIKTVILQISYALKHRVAPSVQSFPTEPQHRNECLTRCGRTAAFKRRTEHTWRVPTAQKPVCVSTPTAGSRLLGQTNGESLCFLALLTLICSSSVRTQSLYSLWLRKTAISALCSLCCTSDSPFSHFLAFIRFNSSAGWAISLAILVCTVSRSLLYLLIPLWLAELNNILKKEEKALSTNFLQHQNNKFQSLKQQKKKKGKRKKRTISGSCYHVPLCLFCVKHVTGRKIDGEDKSRHVFLQTRQLLITLFLSKVR